MPRKSRSRSRSRSNSKSYLFQIRIKKNITLSYYLNKAKTTAKKFNIVIPTGKLSSSKMYGDNNKFSSYIIAGYANAQSMKDVKDWLKSLNVANDIDVKKVSADDKQWLKSYRK